MPRLRTVLSTSVVGGMVCTLSVIAGPPAGAASEPPTVVTFQAPGVQDFDVDTSGPKDVTHQIRADIHDATAGTFMTYSVYTCDGDQIAGVTREIAATGDQVTLDLGERFAEFQHGSWIVAAFKAPGHSLFDATQQFLPNSGGWDFAVCADPVKPEYPGDTPTDPAPPTLFPSATVKSWGRISGPAKPGETVKAAGFAWGRGAEKVSGEKVTYAWRLAGRSVKAGRSYKIPKRIRIGSKPVSTKGKVLSLKVTVSKSGYRSLTKTLSKKVKSTHAGKRLPATMVRSWGKARGEVRAGHQVRSAGFKWGAGAKRVQGEKVTYIWRLSGKRAKTGRFFRLPKKSQGKQLQLRVRVSAQGYQPHTRTVLDHRIGKAKLVCPAGQVLVGPDDFGHYMCWSVVQQRSATQRH